MGDEFLDITNSKGQITLDGTGVFSVAANLSSTIQANRYLNLECNGTTDYHTRTGNLSIYNQTGNVIISAPSMFINALDPISNIGGLIIQSGAAGISASSIGGDIILDSQGSNITLGGDTTRNLAITVDDHIDISAAAYNVVASDTISLISLTGNVHIGGADPDHPILGFQNGNLLINQASSTSDRQVDIALDRSSTNKHGFNGAIITSHDSNVTPDLEFRTSAGSSLSCGIYNTGAPAATFMAYQTGNILIPVASDEYLFTSADIGRTIHWQTTNRHDTILDLAYMVAHVSDSSNIAITGDSFTFGDNSPYILEIDSLATSNSIGADTFSWRNGNFVPCTAAPVLLDAGIYITWTTATGHYLGQQIAIYPRISAVLSNTSSIDAPELVSILYGGATAYLASTHAANFTFDDNKIRLAHDDTCGFQTDTPAATIHATSRVGQTIIANDQITGDQRYPAIAALTSDTLGFVMCWTNENVIAAKSDIICQLFHKDGSPSDANILVTSGISGDSTFPAICAHHTHKDTYMIGFVAANDAEFTQIYARIYRGRVPLTSYIPISTEDLFLHNNTQPHIAVLLNGNYALTWASINMTAIHCAIIQPLSGTVASVITINYSASPYRALYPRICALMHSDPFYPGGFVIAWLASDYAIDDGDVANGRYFIKVGIYTADYTSATPPFIIMGRDMNAHIVRSMSLGRHSICSYGDLKGTTRRDGGFLIAYYENYDPQPANYNTSDNMSASISKAFAILGNPLAPGDVAILPVVNYTAPFVIGEEITIASSVPNIGTVIHRISAIAYTSSTTALLTLDMGYRAICAVKFASNATAYANNLFNIAVNADALYQEAATDRPLADIIYDPTNDIALISWITGAPTSRVAYNMIECATGIFLRPLDTTLDIRSRAQCMCATGTIYGEMAGFVIGFENILDMDSTGIAHRIIPCEFGNDLFRLANHHYDAGMCINQLGHCGINMQYPDATVHVQNMPHEHCIIKLQQNTVIGATANAVDIIACPDKYTGIAPTSIYTHSVPHMSIIFTAGTRPEPLAQISGGYSANYQSLAPRIGNLIGYFTMDVLHSMILHNEAPANTDGTTYSHFILQDCVPTAVAAPGVINGGMLFNGAGNYASYAPTNYIGLKAATAEDATISVNVWVKLVKDNPASGAHYSIISNRTDFAGGSATGSFFDFHIIDNISAGGLSPAISLRNNPASYTRLVAETALTPELWYNLGFIVAKSGNNALLLIYINGAFACSTQLDGPCSSSSYNGDAYVLLGAGSTGSTNTDITHFYRGFMDELRIYNTALTMDEMAILYKYGNSRGGSLEFAAKSLDGAPDIAYKNVVTLDDTGSIANITAKPRNAYIINSAIATSKTSVAISAISSAGFTPAFNTGDILRINNGTATNDYSVISVTGPGVATVDRPTYAGIIGDTGVYNIPLCLPAIQRWATEDDSLRAVMDYHGRLMIGNCHGQPASLVELIGDSGTYAPVLSLTNSDSDGTQQSAIQFRGKLADDFGYYTLATIAAEQIATSNNIGRIKLYAAGPDDTLVNAMTATGYGKVAIGPQDTPLARCHIYENAISMPCQLLLESNYLNMPNTDGAVFKEMSALVFAGQQSLTESNDLTSNTLAQITGSNDGWEHKPDGRIDFFTNNSATHAAGIYLARRMSITKHGYLGLDIANPANLLEIAPHIGGNTPLAVITSEPDGTGNTTIQLNNNIFAGMSPRTIERVIAGSVTVVNRMLDRIPVATIANTSNLTVEGINHVIAANTAVSIHIPALVVTPDGDVGIGTNTPVATLHANGSLALAIHSVTAVSVVLDDRYCTVIAKSDGNGINVELPDATVCGGRIYMIKRVGANNVAVVPSGAQILEAGNVPYVLGTNYEKIRVQSDGEQWWIV
jgi:hypothetical protein